MKKYLLTLSSLALSLGMTHAAENAVVVTGDEAASDTTAVFGGGSVVSAADPFAGMIVADTKTEGDDENKLEMVREETAVEAVAEATAPVDAAPAGDEVAVVREEAAVEAVAEATAPVDVTPAEDKSEINSAEEGNAIPVLEEAPQGADENKEAPASEAPVPADNDAATSESNAADA